MSRGSFEGLTENHWETVFVGEKMEHWNSAPEEKGEERELWTSCLSVFFCVFVWGDDWEFPVPPPCYLSPESRQTCCTGWRKVEFVDFERGKRRKIYLVFELSQQQHTQQPYLGRVCMGIKIKSQITRECSTQSGRTAVFFYSSCEIYSWVYFLHLVL